jgi:hypothetical protein
MTEIECRHSWNIVSVSEMVNHAGYELLGTCYRCGQQRTTTLAYSVLLGMLQRPSERLDRPSEQIKPTVT